jgi:atypical dual specificity phosphatase
MPAHVVQGSLVWIGTQLDTFVHEAHGRLIQQYSCPSGQLSSGPFQLLLLTDAEMSDLGNEKISYPTAIERHIFPLGIAKDEHEDEYFLVIIWTAANQWRKGLGLPFRQFYVGLTDGTSLEGDKSIGAILPNEFHADLPPEKLDHLALSLYMENDFKRAMEISIITCQADPVNERGFLRLGDAASRLGLHKLAMMSYAATFRRSTDKKVNSYCIKRMLACAEHTELGNLFRHTELPTIPDNLASYLKTPWTMELREQIADRSLTPVLCLESRERMCIPGPSIESNIVYILPRFFRWLVPFHLALMSTPKSREDIAALASPHIGIRHVLTLTEEEPLPAMWFSPGRIDNTFLPIPNYQPPTIEQMDLIMRLLQDGDRMPMLVHCGGGKGRAGTVAACYIVAHGFNKPDPSRSYPAMSAPEAIAALCSFRPGSIETTQQEEFVGKWCSALWKRGSLVPPPTVPEPPPCELEIQGQPDLPKADLVVLVGLPGSGKSWFSSAALARNPTGWIHISQDEAGSRSTCETQIGRTPTMIRGGPMPKVLLDRCNTSQEDRISWLRLAQWSTVPICVHFDYNPEVSRVSWIVKHL